MILEVYEDQNRIHRVKFNKGANFIVADQFAEANNRDTRNGGGKSTLLNIIHFVLGADLSDDLFPSKKLHDYIFCLKLSLQGKVIDVKRSVASPKVVQVIGDISNLPTQIDNTILQDQQQYEIGEWKSFLGQQFFGITKEDKLKGSPSFRQLFSYFARRGPGAFIEAFEYSSKQKATNNQANNAFLLGLNWRLPLQAKILDEDNQKNNKNNTQLDLGKLRADQVNLDKQIKVNEEQLKSFKVHPNYTTIQKEADRLTEEIHELNNRNYELIRKQSRYKESITQEAGAGLNIASLYSQAQVVLREDIQKTLSQASDFHSGILESRKEFLNSEILELSNEIDRITEEIAEVSATRADMMKLLSSHKALEEFHQFQEALFKLKTDLKEINDLLIDHKEVKDNTAKLKQARQKLETQLSLDYEASREQWEQLISTFNEFSLELYNEGGSLIINIADEGKLKQAIYKYDIDIPRNRSDGVGKMKIFCYDLMLVQKFARAGKINFLIHDSNIFDGVDSRQVAKAIELADAKGQKEEFQYICILNSDQIPEGEFSKQFDFDSKIKLTLSDKPPKQSILQCRF